MKCHLFYFDVGHARDGIRFGCYFGVIGFSFGSLFAGCEPRGEQASYARIKRWRIILSLCQVQRHCVAFPVQSRYSRDTRDVTAIKGCIRRCSSISQSFLHARVPYFLTRTPM